MDQDSSAPAQPRRRGRPPGRSLRQEEQRKLNRAAIVAAAASVFAAKPYVHATIDDIIAAASISRATFYVHFESKLALAIEIYDSIGESWLEHFDQLATLPHRSVDELKQWTLALTDLYVDHGYVTPLVEQLILFEPRFRQRLAEDRDLLIDRLAKAGLPGFVAATNGAPEALLQRARLRLLLLRLDEVCGILMQTGANSPDADAYIAVIAEELRDRIGPPTA